jgi:putative SOS response-associated peptidase YedK
MQQLMVDIHDRMPLILAPTDYVRWLGDKPDPLPNPCGRGRPPRVNKPENDNPSIVEPIVATA